MIKGGTEGKKAATAVMWDGKLLPAWYMSCMSFAKLAKFGTAVQLTVDELALEVLFKEDFVRYVVAVRAWHGRETKISSKDPLAQHGHA